MSHWRSFGLAIFAAFCLLGEVTPQREGNLVRWTTSDCHPLTIERLKSDDKDEYIAFQKIIAKISGVNFLCSGHLIHN
jgi:hypothetical protein